MTAERTTPALEHARRMDALGRLAGGIAHDFNNLLTSIRGLGALALDELEADHPIRPDLQEILNAAQRATEVTTQLLAFAGRQRVETAVVDVNSLVAEAAHAARAAHPALGLEVTTDPSSPAVAADPHRLRQAIANLLGSAARAVEGTGAVRVETSRHRVTEAAAPILPPGDYAVVRVSDTGRLAPDQLDTLFEPFAPPRSAAKGAGLDLAVAYGIVRRAGGLLVADALPDAVRISAYLPLASSESDRMVR